MAVFCVTNVRLMYGEAVELRIRLVDGATNTWQREPVYQDASTVANWILAGDDVYLLFPIAGGHVLGPRLKVKTMPGGVKTVEVDGEAVEGRRLQDMPKF